jgi:hypothetical protein
MGDVLSVARRIVEETRKSREERARILAATQQRIQELTTSFLRYDAITEKSNALKEKIYRLRKQILKKELAQEEAKKGIGGLSKEADGIKKEYADLIGAVDTQIKNIDTELENLTAREKEIDRQRAQYRSALHMEVMWIAEGEIREIADLREALKKKRISLLQDRSYLDLHRDEPAGLLNQLEDMVAGTVDRFIMAEEARLYELNYLSRFDTKMNRFPVRIFSPLESTTYTVTKWDEHYRYDSGAQPAPREGTSSPASPPGQMMPVNAGSVYVIAPREHKYFGKRVKKVVVEAFSFCSPDEYSQIGFDTRPLTMTKLLPHLTPFIQKAESEGYFHVLGIASPTGWDERVISAIKADGSGTAYLSRNLAVCLIDSTTGEAQYNPSDRRVLSFVDYFRPEFDEEKLARVKKAIHESLGASDNVQMEDVVKQTGVDRDIIQKAFYDLQNEGSGRVRFAEGVGLVLLK